MIRNIIRIVGINPGTRYLGIAVLYGQELMDWRIKTLPGKWSVGKIEKAKEILADLIDFHDPSVLVIKKLHAARRTQNLERLVKTIKDHAKRKGLGVCQYSIKEIEKRFVEAGKLNKRNLIEAMARQYPPLGYDLAIERRSKNPYYFRLFEAVALGSMFFNYA
jgi:Holliday junction resolvasome RuvABC endonuclease subunit